MSPEDLEHRAFSVRCPLCNSRPYVSCYTERGDRMELVHMARLDAIQRVIDKENR